MIEFPADRWARAGASEAEIDVLRQEHDALPVAEQSGMVGWIGSVSDDDIAALLVERRDAQPDGFVAADPPEAVDPPVSETTRERHVAASRAKHAAEATDGDAEVEPKS